MVWQQWVLIGFYAVSILATIATIGKPRKPITPEGAVSMMIVSAGIIALVVTI